MNVTLKKKEDTVTDRLKSMLDKAESVQAFFNRVIFKMYQDAQRQRWETEGDSEGLKWPPLSEQYSTYKHRKFAAFPGGGTKMMIATGTLKEATIDEPNKIATNKRLFISVDTSVAPYASYPAEARPIMKFSDNTKQKMRDKILIYLKGL